MSKSNKAKEMVMKPCFRMKVVEDKKKKSYSRKTKHKNRGYKQNNHGFFIGFLNVFNFYKNTTYR